MARKKLTAITLFTVILCSIFVLVSCGIGGGDDPTPQTPTKLNAPVVTLVDDVATWAADAYADRFEISIDGNLSYLENTVTNKKLTDGQSFKIRAIGDGTKFSNSDWSNVVTYTKHSEPPTTQKFTIKWKNGDEVLEIDVDVLEGTVPEYNGAEPVKEADLQYNYVFTGWTPEVVAASGNTSYTAVFTPVLNTYTVTWKNGDTVLEIDENVEYGTIPTYNGDEPVKEHDALHVYTFSGWSPTVDAVVGDVTYFAQFADVTETFSVTFCDWDGEIISEQMVAYGASATAPEGLHRDGYRFDGWDKSYDNITTNIVVTAKYVEEFEVQFLDYDGSVIYSEYVDKGSNFINIPNDPERIDYSFTGWSVTNFTNITEDLAVYALYVRTYRVAFVDYDGTVIKSQNVIIGESANPPEDPVRDGYNFVGWDKTLDNITTNLIVTAMYDINKYIVTFAMPDGSTIVQKTVKHGYPVIAPEVSETYFHFGTTNDQYAFGSGYYFSGWDRELNDITEAQTISAVYGEVITEPIIVVEQKNIVTNESQEVTVSVYIANGKAPYGISLDLQIDPTLLKGGKPTITVSGQQTNTGSEYYESKLDNDGRYECRWTKNTGIQNDTIVKLTFTVNIFEGEGVYPITILDSTYIITEELEKVTPVLISGAVVVK